MIPSVHGEDTLPPDPWTVQLLFLNNKILKKDDFRLGDQSRLQSRMSVPIPVCTNPSTPSPFNSPAAGPTPTFTRRCPDRQKTSPKKSDGEPRGAKRSKCANENFPKEQRKAGKCTNQTDLGRFSLLKPLSNDLF